MATSCHTTGIVLPEQTLIAIETTTTKAIEPTSPNDPANP